MKKIVALSSLILSVFLAGCQQSQGYNQYEAGEMGMSRSVEFATILNIRPVEVFRKERGVGALAGAAAGGGAGSYMGSGSGQTWATVGGVVAGAVVGDMVEQEMNRRDGLEYVLEMRDGDVKTIALEKNDDEPVLKVGDKVMLQSCDAGDHYKRCKSGDQFQRLIPVERFPSDAHKAKKKSKKKRAAPMEDEADSESEQPKKGLSSWWN
jgi:outer membrane lipoprotein SlyB